VQLEEHLFRRESARMVSALTRVFGLENLALAEDVVQDAFCRALSLWPLRGIPDNPSAWLMRTAKNRAIDVLRRERTARTSVPELERLLASEWTLVPTVSELFGAASIKDDQLRMMFSCCHPRLPEQSQVALILHLLCGFSVSEVAGAFLAGEPGIEKRLGRAKKVLAASKQLFEFNDREFPVRLAAVQRAIYLLFSEGYHGASTQSAVRVELCREAMRLGATLLEHPRSATRASQALCALLWLDAARLPARLDAAGDLLALAAQDRRLWDRELIAQGLRYLEGAAEGAEPSQYHIEAAIAAVHSNASSFEDTDWAAIVALYDALMLLRPSPVVALNRAIAIAQLEGPDRGLEELEQIVDRERLAAYPFYPAAFGELELTRGRHHAARAHFTAALALARSPAERRFLQRRVEACQSDHIMSYAETTPAVSGHTSGR
jgi:RNA polymerase sigma factor (sigma-70 family)